MDNTYMSSKGQVVIRKTVRDAIGLRQGEEDAYLRIEQMRLLPIDVLPADEKIVMSAARLKARHGVSYANAFAIASSQSTEGVLMTGDPKIRKVPNLNLCYIGR